MIDAVLDPATMPIVAAFDARDRDRKAAQADSEDADYFTFAVSRRMDDRRRDMATLGAVIEWAREAPVMVPPLPDGVTFSGTESPEAFDLRANILRMASEAP
jgi:hypothetical protein